ncbi:MAG: c-type cytochrome [Gaiellaceae bacterium]
MRSRRALILLIAVLALALAGCGGSEEAAPLPETVEGTVAGTEGETETTETDGGGQVGDATAGKAVFDANGCGGCHTLEAAGSSGNVGPNLDDSKPDAALVTDRVTNGKGAMPAFGSQLSEADIANVAAFVVESTGG